MSSLQKAVEIVAEFEGCKLQPYLCPADVATIGFGHAITDKNGVQLKGAHGLAQARQMSPRGITVEEAHDLLCADLARFAADVDAMVTVPLSDNERCALVSFAFNVGSRALKTSTLLRRLNQGDKAGVAGEFLRWTRGGGRVLLGLVRRRRAERSLWLGER